MKRAFVPLALLAVASSALAQGTRDPIGIRVRLAYGTSSSFSKSVGSAKLEGPEIGLAFPIGSFLGEELLLEPSFFGGGRTRKGADDDADVYRLTLFAHHTFGKNIGVRAGIGYSNSTRARGGGFGGVSDVIFDFGVEVPFKFVPLNSYSPFVDVHAVVAADEKRLSGFFLGIGAKL